MGPFWYTCMSAWLHAHMHMRTHAHTYIYIYMYGIYINIYIYLCKNTKHSCFTKRSCRNIWQAHSLKMQTEHNISFCIFLHIVSTLLTLLINRNPSNRLMLKSYSNLQNIILFLSFCIQTNTSSQDGGYITVHHIHLLVRPTVRTFTLFLVIWDYPIYLELSCHSSSVIYSDHTDWL